ncbi:hypothetical protein I4U23_016688 [Adineta vaga]|nr:hypothetical protein I4U23_016688 [Adineta vaga]
MTSRVKPFSIDSPTVSIDVDQHIAHQSMSFDEEFENRTLQTIDMHLKQAACCQDSRKTKAEWKIIDKIFQTLPYKNSENKVIEKLDENNYSPIHYAVRWNNYYSSNELLNSPYKCNVNLPGCDGQTPLHIAACSSKIEQALQELMNNGRHVSIKESILHLLLRHQKIKINAQDDKGRTPLHHALMRNHTKITEILIQFGANPNTFDIQGATSFHYEYYFRNNERQTQDVPNEHEQLDIIRKYFQNSSSQLIPKHGMKHFVANIIRYHESGYLSDFVRKKQDLAGHILQLICQESNGEKLLDVDKISNLLTIQTMGKSVSKDGYTPLMIAIKYRRKGCVESFLNEKYCNKEIMKESRTNFDRGVLHICAEYPNQDITDTILKKAKSYGLNLAPMDKKGDTPLHICAQNNNIYMCERLLSTQENNTKSNVSKNTTDVKTISSMLQVRNYDGLTAFHQAVMNENYEIVELMIKAAINPKELIDDHDDKLQTSLHKAALKGNAKIVRLFLGKEANVNARDINYHLPLHEAVHWSDLNEEENQNRIECINDLIEKQADVNALNIHRESALFIACRYGSAALIECLLKHGADLFQINIHNYNCLEVAIEEKNQECVKYFIEHESIFQLMRNAQVSNSHSKPCCSCGSQTIRQCCCVPCCKCVDHCSYVFCRLCSDRHTVDTPIRKLILHMPDMAFEILEKCTTTIGNDKSTVYRKFYDYEFLEDQYIVHQWQQGDCIIDQKKYQNKPYTRDFKTLVMNHPLFLMAVHNRYKLMTHPLSMSLVYKKFFWFSYLFFIGIFLLYAIFLAIYTVIVLRREHPHKLYNLTGFDFNDSLCENVIQALGNRDLKDIIDERLYILVIVLLSLNVIKNIWVIISYIRIDWRKTFTFIFEIISLGCNYYFVIDTPHRFKYRMRCPYQWQIGAYGLFSGYLALFYYLQYIPIFGIYVIMMKQILIRFILFLPVLTVLICAFTFPLYMIFQNFETFSDFIISLAKIIIMSTGEINYDDLMFNDNYKAYYKVGFFLLVLFAICMTILASNLLIGVAVGEIAPMMNTARNIRIDIFYELTADLEILKLQFLYWFNRCGCCYILPKRYEEINLKKQWKWFRNQKKRLLECCGEAVQEEMSNESKDEKNDYTVQILEEVRKGIQHLDQKHPVSKNLKTSENRTNSTTKKNKNEK